MDILLGKPEENFENGSHWVKEAKQQGSSLVLFPELWLTGYDLENATRHASEINSGWFLRLSDMARKNHIGLGGSILEKDGDRIYNTFSLFDFEGNLIAKYRKIHLFRLMDEDRWLTAGEGLCMAESEWGKVGISICYDLRFPEMFRKYAVDGAKVFFISAEWPETRIEHWRTLLKARAIEDQVYVVACNRIGESKGEIFGGHSAIIDPWGNVLVEAGDCESLITTQIDLEEVSDIRKLRHFISDRRNDIYG